MRQDAVDDDGTDDHGTQAFQKETPAQNPEGTQDDGDIQYQGHGTNGQPGKKVDDQRQTRKPAGSEPALRRKGIHTHAEQNTAHRFKKHIHQEFLAFFRHTEFLL